MAAAPAPSGAAAATAKAAVRITPTTRAAILAAAAATIAASSSTSSSSSSAAAALLAALQEMLAPARPSRPRLAPSCLASSSRHTIFSPIFRQRPAAPRLGSTTTRGAHSIAAAAAAATSVSNSASASSPPPMTGSASHSKERGGRGATTSRAQGLASTTRRTPPFSQPSGDQRSKLDPQRSTPQPRTPVSQPRPLATRSEAELVAMAKRVQDAELGGRLRLRGWDHLLFCAARIQEILVAAEGTSGGTVLTSQRVRAKREIAKVLQDLVDTAASERQRGGATERSDRTQASRDKDLPEPDTEMMVYHVMAVAHKHSPARATRWFRKHMQLDDTLSHELRTLKLPDAEERSNVPLKSPFRAESKFGLLAAAMASIVDSAVTRFAEAKGAEAKLRELHDGIMWLVDVPATSSLIRQSGQAERLFERFSMLADRLGRRISDVIPAGEALPSVEAGRRKGSKRPYRGMRAEEEPSRWHELRASTEAMSQLCAHLARLGSTQAASTYYFWARKVGTKIHEWAARRVLVQLSQDKSWALAEQLIDDIREQAPSAPSGPRLELQTLRTLAKHRARQGDDAKLNETVWAMKHFHPEHEVLPHLVAQLSAQAAAVNGRPRECLARLRDFYAVDPTDEEGFRVLSRAPPWVWRRVVQAHVNASDVEAAERAFYDHMSAAGVQPDYTTCVLLLSAYAKADDVDAALALVDSMRAVSLRFDAAMLSTLIAMFGRRQDSESAAVVMRTFVNEYGVKPDRACYTALMDAHVEAGDWDAAMHVFSFLEGHSASWMKPTVKECNVILKAHVLRASPVQTVQAFYRSLHARNVEPDAHTFALLLSSASDAGLMDLAEDMMDEVRRLRLGPNLYHFTIVMHGYIRLGMIEEAKRVFDEMRASGVRPSSATWSILVQMYAKSGRGEDMNLAYELVRRLIDADADAREKRTAPATLSAKTADEGKAESEDKVEEKSVGSSDLMQPGASFEDLFTPLIAAATSAGSRSRAEELVKELAQTGTKVSLRTWTMLLDAYRREGDVEGAKAAWDVAFDMARNETVYSGLQLNAADGDDAEPSSSAPSVASSLRPRRNALCLPLSILIDTLSTAGDHEGVARAWTQTRDAGFGFDTHNWNHLALALVRAGRLGEAMTVLENVLVEPPPGLAQEDAERREEREALVRREREAMETKEREAAETRAKEQEAATSSGVEAAAAENVLVDSETPVLEVAEAAEEIEILAEPLSASPDPSLHPAPPLSDEVRDVTSLAHPVPTPSRPPNRRHQVRINDDLHTRFVSAEEEALQAEEEDEVEEMEAQHRPSRAEMEEMRAAQGIKLPSSALAHPPSLSEAESPSPPTFKADAEDKAEADEPPLAERDPRDVLSTLRDRRKDELRKAHWFPSFAVLQALSGALEELRRGGGTASRGKMSSGRAEEGEEEASAPLYSSLIRRHPHAADLLAMHGRKLEAMQERHRRAAMRETYRGFLVGGGQQN